MTINRTTLLDLPLPVTGTESGTWGDVTNNGLTQYLDIAIAGRTALTSSDFIAGALTISTTEGDSSATNIVAGSAQYATLYVSSLAANSTITAPSSNRAYRVFNADSTYTLTVKASGQTGVTFPVGTSGTVVFNGTDYVLLGTFFNTATVISVADNTNAALRITQTGTGNALLVEDSTNPDSTPFLIDNVGGVVNGYTTPLSIGSFTPRYQQHGNSANFRSLSVSSWQAGTDVGAEIFLTRGDNTAIGDYTLIGSTDVLGNVRFYGADGTQMVEAAKISSVVDGAPGANDMPGRLVFSTTADGASAPTERMRITSAGKTGFATSAPASTVHVAGDTILSNVNVISASYDSVSFSVATEELTPTDLFFSPDGTRMYVTGTTGDDVNQYSLSTPWVVSSATYVTVFSVSGQDTQPNGIFFRADGLKMYILGVTNDTIFQYTLSTPWSVATASYDSVSFSVATQELTPTGLSFRPNGLSMYVTGSTGDAVHQYTLSTAWNVSTATFLQSFSVSSQDSNPQGITFTGDGSRMFLLGQIGDDVNVYNLTTPWNISTAVFVNVFSIVGQDDTPTGIYIKPDGTKMYITGAANDTVYQYTIPSIEINLTGTTNINGGATVAQDLTVNGNLTFFGGAYQAGYRNIPPVGTKTGSYTLATSDVGEYVQVGSGGSITIPNSTFAEGDVISIFNNTSGNITITCSITTAYIAGTDSDKASVTLATRGIASVLFISGTVCVITGNVS
jgi:DNA-binding beta-propeller fold protein YncE